MSVDKGEVLLRITYAHGRVTRTAHGALLEHLLCVNHDPGDEDPAARDEVRAREMADITP